MSETKEKDPNSPGGIDGKKSTISLSSFLHLMQIWGRAEVYYYKGNFDDNTEKTVSAWKKITGLK